MSSAEDAVVNGFVKAMGSDRSRLLDIVETVQAHFGFVGEGAVQAIAHGLSIHAVEVEDMLSFYAFFDRQKRGRYRIRLSRTPISFMKGAREVAGAFEQALGIEMGGTTQDFAFTLQWTSDIGMADQEPAALVNGMVLAELAPGDVPAILCALRQCDQLRGGAHDHSPRLAGNAIPKQAIRSSLRQAGPLLAPGATQDEGLNAALLLTPDQVIARISDAKLRGRGGAGFPTGTKWRLTRKSSGRDHIVACNADEGEPGTFKDRMLLTEFPDLIFEGITIAGYALGARHGLMYLRGEYAYLWQPLQDALTRRRKAGLLGASICGRAGFDFDIRIQLGAGAYICGEESSMIESLEGKRGAPRDRPPFPTERGYLQQPTAVDNVETYLCAARIMAKGADWFKGFGTVESSGTKLMSVSGDCTKPGVYEVPFGITVNELIDLAGGGDAAYVQVSGPSGQSVAPKDFGRRIAYEDLSTGGSTMIFGPNRDVLDIALQFSAFFVAESCGWCTPCRVGTTLLQQGMEKIVAGRATLADVEATEALAETVARMSRCGLGQSAPNPILSTMRNFPELYEARLHPEAFVPRVTLDEALRDAVLAQGREPVAEEV
jgi:[NiFe] hydrogenase diaphorase moiety large subunit